MPAICPFIRDRLASALWLLPDGLPGKAAVNSTMEPKRKAITVNLPESTSENGIRLIMKFEGLRLQRYRDPAGKWTIGYGHLILPEEKPQLITITSDEARQLLIRDLQRTEQGIKKLLTVGINQNQFDALVSFAFNLGIGNLKRSRLLRQLNAGETDAAARQFLVWNRVRGRVLPGLVRRRKAEMTLFLTPPE